MIQIRAATDADLQTIYEIINDSASAYKGVIPAEAWHEPYMPLSSLESEIAKGVRFCCCDLDGCTIGVMGTQDVKDVMLIRHAYVRTDSRAHGVGRALLTHATHLTDRPILIGAWRTASWAIQFYERNGFSLLSDEEARRLFGKYWTISDFQVRESVVLADRKWLDRAGGA